MCKAHFASLLGVLGVVCALHAIPYPGYFFPSSMQVGTKVQVVAGGTAFWGVKGAYVTGEGVEVTRLVRVPSFPRAIGKEQGPFVVNWMYDLLENKLPAGKRHRELPPSAFEKETDWSENSWWPYLDERDDLEMQIIARDRFTPESYPQPTPALDTLLILDIEAFATAKPGRRELILYDERGASAPHAFFLTKDPHICEKFFVTPSREQRKAMSLPNVLHLPTPFPPQNIPVVINGQNWPGETDSYYLRLEEGQNLVCILYGRELLPYLGDAVPGWYNPMMRLSNSRGQEVAAADDFYYLSDPILTYTVTEPGFYRLDVFDNLYRGRSDFVYFVHCFNAKSDAPVTTPQARAFVCYPPAQAHCPPAKARAGQQIKTGTLDFPGREDRYTFEIKEPCAWTFELYARRMGSPLDGVLKLYGPMGQLPLSAVPKRAEWDDNPNRLFALKNVGDDEKPIIKTNMLYVGSIAQVEIDPRGTWKFDAPGKYTVSVCDRIGAGGEHFDYTLVMGPTEPTFEVYSSMSAFLVRENRDVNFQAYVLRRGFKGPISFQSSDEWEVSGETSTDDENEEITVSVRPKKALGEGVKQVQLYATGESPEGTRLTVRVTPCDPTEQAFAYTHLLPQHAFYFCSARAKDILVKDPHPPPHLGPKGGESGAMKKKTSHSNGRACASCHTKKKSHTKGKKCMECHTDKN